MAIPGAHLKLDAREAVLSNFEVYKKTHPIHQGDAVLLIEKFGIKEGNVVPAFSEGAETHEAFTDSPLKDGRVTYLEYTPFNRKKEPEHRIKEGFVFAGQIINVSALAIFNFPNSTDRHAITLNGTKSPAGSMEESDTRDAGSLTIAEALNKVALREFSEEVLGLTQGENLTTEKLNGYITQSLGAEPLKVTPLIEQLKSGSIVRLPKPEFNTIFCSPTVIIELGTVSEDIASKLKKEEGKSDIPQVCPLSDLVSKESRFRNKDQLKHFIATRL